VTGIIVLISFFFTALIEVIFTVVNYKWEMPIAIEYTISFLQPIFISIALITSLRGLFFKDSTPKKLKFLYLIASVVWMIQLAFVLHMTYFAN
tara:strand:+ start:41 stop:319 length:279 start_codon:yes stop_codon:yes gene_type:complete